MKNKDEILRKFDEAIQYFINCSENLPGTDFCNNVDKLIDIKCDIANGVEQSASTCNLHGVNVSVLSVSEKPAGYVQKHLLRAMKNIEHAKKHIDNHKRLNKSDMRKYMGLIKEPFMRAYGYVFPDEIVYQREAQKFYENKTER